MEAFDLAGADPCPVPLNDLRSRKADWRTFQMLVIPGGFSYADALGAGKLLALDLAAYFADEIESFVASGKPVIGICNGFQALVKAGILPGKNKKDPGDGQRSTLTYNAQGHFECRWVNLQPVSQKCVWTGALDELITCPVAHGEGNFQVTHHSLLNGLAENDQIALTYVQEDGAPANGSYPSNPNGSMLDIAGICNPAGNVLGLMPHPENHIHAYQHPQWTRGAHSRNGLPLFNEGVKYASQLR